VSTIKGMDMTQHVEAKTKTSRVMTARSNNRQRKPRYKKHMYGVSNNSLTTTEEGKKLLALSDESLTHTESLNRHNKVCRPNETNRYQPKETMQIKRTVQMQPNISSKQIKAKLGTKTNEKHMALLKGKSHTG